MNVYADTNILVRLLVKDDDDQLNHIVKMVDYGEYRLIISSTVVIELCWVLKSIFKLDNGLIGNGINELINVENLFFEEENIIKEVAFQLMKNMKIDVVDIYLSVKSKRSGHPVLTWDSDFSKLDCEWYKPSDL